MNGRETERQRDRGCVCAGVGLSIDVNAHIAEEALTHPRHQSEDGPGMRDEGDRIEGEAAGLRGAVRARWLHPFLRLCAA